MVEVITTWNNYDFKDNNTNDTDNINNDDNENTL